MFCFKKGKTKDLKEQYFMYSLSKIRKKNIKKVKIVGN